MGLTSPLQKWQKKRCAATAEPASAPAAEASAMFRRRGCPSERAAGGPSPGRYLPGLRSPPPPPSPPPRCGRPLLDPQGSREPARPREARPPAAARPEARLPAPKAEEGPPAATSDSPWPVLQPATERKERAPPPPPREPPTLPARAARRLTLFRVRLDGARLSRRGGGPPLGLGCRSPEDIVGSF